MHTMFRLARLAALLLAGLTTGSVRGADPVFSGPQPGEPTTAFKVIGITGVEAGKERDPTAAGRPMRVLSEWTFVRELM